MPAIAANEIELFYDAAGDKANPAILLVAGLGVQMIDWPDYFVDALLEAGHYVIRFDNRDIGLSTTFDGAPHEPQVVVDALLAGEAPNVAYTLTDMAADAAALLDALNIEAANVIGVSMGGMIVQTMAINHPDKVQSLTSIMSSTGSPDVGQPTPEAMVGITTPGSGPDREAVIEHSLKNAQIWASPGHFDSVRMRNLFEQSWDRVGGPQALNAGRHFCAIMASAPRDEALTELSVPTLVVHGSADTLIAPSGGERTAAMVPDAKLLMIEGMGHDLPQAFAPDIVAAITELISRTATA